MSSILAAPVAVNSPWGDAGEAPYAGSGAPHVPRKAVSLPGGAEVWPGVREATAGWTRAWVKMG